MAERKIVLGPHRLSYVHLDKPSAVGDGKPKYNVTVLIPKDHGDVDKIEDMLDAIYKDEREATFAGKKFEKITHPLKDGDEYYDEHPDNPEYKGCFYLRLSSESQPAVFDRDGNEVIDIREECYSGMYGKVIGLGYAYNWQKTKQGFGFFLNGVKKTKDGEKLGGFTVSADDFEDGPAKGGGRRKESRPERDEPRRGSSRREEEYDDRRAPRREDSRDRREREREYDDYEQDEPRRGSSRREDSRDRRDARGDEPRRGSTRRVDREEDDLYIDDDLPF